MEELLKLITNYGFPVVVSIYLLVRLERRIADLEKAITSLASKIDTLVGVKR
jgi:hypothetical protein